MVYLPMRAMRTYAKKKECANAPADPFTTFSHCVYIYNMRSELIFSDMLYRFPADYRNGETSDSGLQTSNAFVSSFAFWSGERWLDSETFSNSTRRILWLV